MKLARASRLALAMLGVCAAAAAESLPDAWKMAQENDPAIQAAMADVESARAAESAARGARLPSLSATGNYSRFSEPPELSFPLGNSQAQIPIFSGDDYAAAGVALNVPVYTGGRLSRLVAASHQETMGAADSERAQRAAVRLEVARAYIDVLRARRLRRSADTSVASLAAHASDVSSLVERELVARSDLLAAQVAEANAAHERLRAENSVALAEAAYNRRLGQPLDRNPQLDETLPPAPIEVTESPDPMIAAALEGRGELHAWAARVETLALQSQAERGALLPQVSMGARYDYLENEILNRQDFSVVGVGVTWSLYDGGQARQRSASLRAASRAAENRLRDMRSRIELDVRQAWLDVRSARARVAVAARAVTQAEENLRISRELYATGLATNTQVLDAVTLHEAAANNRENALLDAEFALYQLAHATGTL